jgi:hypothetical protein
MTVVLLQLAPALALLLALVLGRYPGERSLDELRRRVAAQPRGGVRPPALRWPRRRALAQRALWLAGAFSARPPPAG